VRQTILESIEAPRLRGVETCDFAEFKALREQYERRVKEKASEQGLTATEAPITSLRNSIDEHRIKLFILLEWVPEKSIDAVSERSLKKCISDRAEIDVEKYDLAFVEKELSCVKLDKTIASLRGRVLTLASTYRHVLEKVGYKKFIETHPRLAVEQIMSKLTHPQLKRRMNLNYSLKRETYRKNYGVFLRDLVKEAEDYDRQESTTKAQTHMDTPRETESFSELRDSNAGAFNAETNPSVELNTIQPTASKPQKFNAPKTNKKRKLPSCLNENCSEYHYIDDCTLTSKPEKKRLFQEYKEAQRRRLESKEEQ